MRIITTVLSLCMAISSIAQSPVITAATSFTIGDSVLVYRKIDTSLSSITPGGSGSQQTWNFNAVNFNVPSVSVDTLYYISPIGTPFYPTAGKANYSAANLCLNRKTDPFSPINNDFAYYVLGNDSLEFIGHWADNGGNEHWEDNFTNFRKELAFPFAYPSAFTDSFKRTFFDYSGSGDHFQTGTYSASVDGYGALTTPEGITLQAVRVHSIETVKDSNVLFGVNQYSNHMYRWYSPNTKGFILSFEMDASNTTIRAAEYHKQTRYNTALHTYNASPLYSISPNPVVNSIHVDGDFSSIKSVAIYNVLGERVLVFDIAQQHYDLSSLASGAYLVSIETAEGVFTQRVVKQ